MCLCEYERVRDRQSAGGSKSEKGIFKGNECTKKKKIKKQKNKNN